MRIIEEGLVNTRPRFTLGQTRDKFRVVEKRRGDVWIEIALAAGGAIPRRIVTEEAVFTAENAARELAHREY